MLFNLIASFILSAQVISTVIGIDYGSDWIKVSVIKPGGLIETVLNRESKRKTNAILNVRGGVRSFGIEALTLGMRFPETTYANLKSVVGKKFEDQVCRAFEAETSNILRASDRSTLLFEHTETHASDLSNSTTTFFQVEELIANLFSHAKKQAEDYALIKVTGAVITLPPHFTHFERQAILDSADIASLKVFALISDESAVAINFAVGKKFRETEYHLIYDMGAGSTIASIISFKSRSGDKKKFGSKDSVDLEVRSFSVDQHLGGRQIDKRLQLFLASEFTRLHSVKLTSSILDNPRAMARLLKEANRCKTILSANFNVGASIENLMDNIDFKLSVSRKTLEGLIEDLISRVTAPIENALSSANLSIQDIKSLVLFGGGVRVPVIQRKISDFVGEGKIARNVDGDEAAVFGSVLHAAAVSAQFRLGQTMNIKDLNPLPIQVTYQSEVGGQNLGTVLFSTASFLGSKKLMTFKRTTDFAFQVFYKSESRIPIAKVSITGLYDAITSLKNKTTVAPKVKVQISLSESGLINFTDATAYFQVPQIVKVESIKDTVMNYWKGKRDDTNQTESIPDDKDQESGIPDAEDVDASDKKVEDEVVKDVAPDSIKLIVQKVPLKIVIEWLTIVPLSKAEKDVMRARFTRLIRVTLMNREDDLRVERESKMNYLESFIYKCKELVYDDDIEEISTPDEVVVLKDGAAAIQEWLEDHQEASTADYVSKTKELDLVSGPILSRRKEHSLRPSVIEKLESEVKNAQSIHDIVTEKINETDITLLELDGLSNAINSTRDWLESSQKAQSFLKLNQNPILTIVAIQDKQAALKKVVKNFNPAKRIKKKAAKPTATQTSISDEEIERMLKSSKMDSKMSPKEMADFLAKAGSGIPTSLPDTAEPQTNGGGDDETKVEADDDDGKTHPGSNQDHEEL